MNKTKRFVITSFLGGVAVILPSVILFILFKWLFNMVGGVIYPLTALVMAKSYMNKIIADILVISLILAVCFLIGITVRTKIGRFIHEKLENHILSFAPGYSIIKETVMQFVGKTESAFGSVALVQIFENSTLMTAFVMDRHENGTYTVFAPTGPNPTSGMIYHLKEEYVHPIRIPVEKAMRSIIACGAGSSSLIAAYHQTTASSEVIKE
jgi:uncharacterized membrane protein